MKFPLKAQLSRKIRLKLLSTLSSWINFYNLNFDFLNFERTKERIHLANQLHQKKAKVTCVIIVQEGARFWVGNSSIEHNLSLNKFVPYYYTNVIQNWYFKRFWGGLQVWKLSVIEKMTNTIRNTPQWVKNHTVKQPRN